MSRNQAKIWGLLCGSYWWKNHSNEDRSFWGPQHQNTCNFGTNEEREFIECLLPLNVGRKPQTPPFQTIRVQLTETRKLILVKAPVSLNRNWDHIWRSSHSANSIWCKTARSQRILSWCAIKTWWQHTARGIYEYSNAQVGKEHRDWVGFTFVAKSDPDPPTLEAAQGESDWPRLDSLTKCSAWEIVERPKNKNIIKSKFDLREKRERTLVASWRFFRSWRHWCWWNLRTGVWFWNHWTPSRSGSIKGTCNEINEHWIRYLNAPIHYELFMKPTDCMTSWNRCCMD